MRSTEVERKSGRLGWLALFLLTMLFGQGRNALAEPQPSGGIAGDWQPEPPRPEQRVLWQMTAELSADLSTLQGSLALYVRPEAPRHDLQVWFFPETQNRIHVADELTFRRVFPAGAANAGLSWNPSRYHQSGVLTPQVLAWKPESPPDVGVASFQLRDFQLSPPVTPENPEMLIGPFRLQIPERAGVFGHLDGQLTLLEGWLPQLVRQKDGKPDPTLAGAEQTLELTLLMPVGLTVLLNGQPMTTDALGYCASAFPPATIQAMSARPGFWDLLRSRQPGASATVEPQASKIVCVSGTITGRAPSLLVGRMTAESVDSGASTSGLPATEATPSASAVSVQKKHTFYDSRWRWGEKRQLSRIFSRAEARWREAGLPEPEAAHPWVRAPLRRTLAEPGEGVLLISDRALRTFPGMRRFHEYALVRGFYLDRILQVFPALAEPELKVAVAEGLSHRLLLRYRKERWWGGLKARTTLEPFGFLPPVDALLNAPQFAFASEVYEDPHRYDVWQERLAQVTRPAPSGEGLFLRLEDRFGAAAVETASQQVLEGKTDFVTLLAAAANVPPESVLAFIHAWMRPPARVDYRLSNVSTRPVGQGYETSFTVSEHWAPPVVPRAKRGAHRSPSGESDKLPKTVADEASVLQTPSSEPAASLPVEPVSILVKSRDETQRLMWEGPQEKTLTLSTRHPVTRIELDPEQRVLESNASGVLLRDNNRWPRPARLLVSAAMTSLDVTSLRPTGSISLSLTRPYQRDWLSSAEVYSTAQTLLGFSAGSFRFLGPYRDTQWRNHRVGLQVLLAHRADLPWLGGSEAYLDTFGVRASWRYESRQLLSDATRGGSAYLALEAGLADTNGAKGGYGVMSLQGVKPLRLLPHLTLVTRGQLDLSVGLPDGEGGAGEGLYSLGASTLLRAVETGERVGNQRWVASLEPRWEVLHDLDLNLGLGRLRRVQWVGFADAGSVGYALTQLPAPDLGVGTGARFYLDMFGLYEGLAGFDVAWRVVKEGQTVTSTSELGPRILLRFTQPF